MLEQNTISRFKLTKCLFSYPHVDHYPLHDPSNAKKDGKEPVHAEATFARDQAQNIADVFTLMEHPGYHAHINRGSIRSPW